MTATPGLVAVDFSEDTLRLLLAESDGTPVLRERWPLPELATEEAWAWEVGGRIATLFARDGDRRSALAIAVAAPGPVDPVRGRLLRCNVRPEWDGMAIVEALRRHIDAPIVVENRTLVALLAETWQGAVPNSEHVLYVSFRGVPAASLLVGGRPARGMQNRAGTLWVLPNLGLDASPNEQELPVVAGVLANAVALFDPEYVVLEGVSQYLDTLTPVLQRVIDEAAPGPKVKVAMLGEEAALFGAVRLAGTVAYESRNHQ